MNRQDYLPIDAAEQALWLGNFAHKLPGHCQTLGIAEATYGPVVLDANYVAYLLSSWIGSLRAFSKSCTSYLEHLQMGEGEATRPVFTEPPLPEGVVERQPGALRRVFAFVQWLKRTPGFDAVMQRDLGLFPRPNETEHPAPKFRLEVERGETSEVVKVFFFKYGHQGVVIRSRRGGAGAKWDPIGTTTASPWIDERPLLVAGQPEVREYQLQFWDKGEPNGELSEAKPATVSP